MIAKLAAVAAGGAIGSALRFLVGHWALKLLGPGFPWGTLAVNVSGSFVMGVAAVALLERASGGLAAWAPFVLAGALGGFTTFSAFSLDTLALAERGAAGLAAAYVLGSVLLCVGACLAGLYLARSVL